MLASVVLIGGCTKTVYKPYPLPPTLIEPVAIPYLHSNNNDGLYEYALQCRAELNLCDKRMSIIREIQEANE